MTKNPSWPAQDGPPPKKRGRKPGNKLLGQRMTKPGKLTPNGEVSTLAHNTATAEAARRERQLKAFDLYAHRRLTMEVIAGVLGVSTKTICQDIWSVVGEMKQQTQATAEEWRALENGRLLQQERELMPVLLGEVTHVTRKVKKGKKFVFIKEPIPEDKVAQLQMDASDRLLRIAARRASLLGLDVSRTDVFTADHVIGVVRGLTGLFMEIVTDVELRRQLAFGMRKRLGGIIDVTSTIATGAPAMAPTVKKEAKTGSDGVDLKK